MGIEKARADLVLFLDADDVLVPHCLRSMLEAYIESDASKYIYADWIAADGEKAKPEKSKDYNRALWERSGLHPISVLIPKEWCYAVGLFDNELPGWEDWDFFIKLAVNGYCGVRIPDQLMIYRTNSGFRREQSFEDGSKTLPILKERYGGYFEGVKSMAGCCGGNGDEVMKAKQYLGLLTAASRQEKTMQVGDSGLVRMEYVGLRRGSTTYRKPGLTRPYTGGNNAINKYADVHPQDVSILEITGDWRQVRSNSGIDVTQAMVPKPDPEVFKPQKPRIDINELVNATIAEILDKATHMDLDQLEKLLRAENGKESPRKTLIRRLGVLIDDIKRVS